jgi:hypothetical protein
MGDVELDEAVARMREWAAENGDEYIQEITDRGWRGFASAALDHHTVVRIDVPGATIGDYVTAKGALMAAACDYIDWERLHDHEPDAIAPPGRILMQIAARLPK